MKILIVDDDSYVRELVPLMAASLGFEDVVAVPLAESALELLKNSEAIFDCLLLDISMPGMNGIELCSLARAIPSYTKTPILMLTAQTGKDYIVRAFKAGATDYVAKPIDVVEFGARLNMAAEVVAARRDAVAAARSERQLREASSKHLFELAEEIEIKGFKNLISSSALDNYLSQLSRAGLGGTKVIAVTIDQIEEVYAHASSGEFAYAVDEVADAICEALTTSRFMMAYAGNGNFLIVLEADALTQSLDVERKIQDVLDAKATEYDDGRPLDLDVSLGNPIQPNMNSTQVVTTTFDRAIARARQRKAEKNIARAG